MKPASFLSVFACASLLLASTGAFAAPGDKPAPKKKPRISSKAPKKVDSKSDKPDKADAAPEPVAPETKAADSKPAEVAPVPVANSTLVSTTPSSSSSDHGTDSRRHDDEDTGKAVSVAPLLGYGSNHFGIGTGARVGYTLPVKVYVGATFMYHFGASYGYAGYGYLGGADYSAHILYPAGEVGYDFHVGPVTIRPYAGVGVAFAGATISYAGHEESSSYSSLLIYPGATAQWNIPRSDFFVGGDTRVAILTRGGDPSFGFYATGGIKF